MRESPLLIFGLSIAFFAMVVSGGPETASQIKRDDARQADIESWAQHEHCRAQSDRPEHCVAPLRSSDPFTGTPYIKKENPERWCARFERTQDDRPGIVDGCVIVTS